MRCPREEQSIPHPRNERRILPTSFPLDFALRLLYWWELQQKQNAILSQVAETDKEAPAFATQFGIRSALFLDNGNYSYDSLLHIVVKGVKHMSDMTTLAVRISKEDKTQLMRCAIERDLSASQIIRQLIRNYIHHCYIETY